MNFNKIFQLKDYWTRFNKELQIKREATILDVENQFSTGKINLLNENWCFGGHSFVVPPDKTSFFINEKLEDIYRRNNLCLKIFWRYPYPLTMNMYECVWGNSKNEGRENLVESSKIQNFFAMEDFAPRVYDLIFLQQKNRLFAAQVVEFIPGENVYDKTDYDLLKKFIMLSGKLNINYSDVDGKNFKNNKFVDFQLFSFGSNFKQHLKGRVEKGLQFGGEEKPYQSIEEMGVKGIRKNLYRDFEIDVRKNDSVLDFGCNGAYFLRRAFDKGASYGVGVDIPRVIKAVPEIVNYLGYFNADFVDKLPSKNFDVVFFLAMENYVSKKEMEEVFNRTNRVCYFESHGGSHGEKERTYLLLKPYFKEVSFIREVLDYKEAGKRILMKGVK